MSTEHERFDTEALRRDIDLVAFAGRYTTLTQISQRQEYAGPCPRCGGEDRFHVKGDHFYCRQCYPRGGDVINLVQMIHGVSFFGACQMLTDGTFSFPEKQAVPSASGVEEGKAGTDWQSEAYQNSARRTVAATHRLLLSGEGAPGQAYLLSRGITEETWRTYQVGFGWTFHPSRRQNLEAIFLPWFGADTTTITALQHRFINEALDKGERYALKSGSGPILFGVQALKPAEMLVVVEGEFNCMSLHQMGVQALSVGSEANIGNRAALTLLQEYAPHYERVIVWFDRAEYGQQVAQRLAAGGLFRKERTRVVVHNQDANWLLAEGQLGEFMARL